MLEVIGINFGPRRLFRPNERTSGTIPTIVMNCGLRSKPRKRIRWPKGIASREELLLEGLIHNRDLLCRAPIFRRKTAAPENGHAKGFEVIGRDRSIVGVRIHVGVGRQRPAFDFEASVRATLKR